MMRPGPGIRIARRTRLLFLLTLWLGLAGILVAPAHAHNAGLSTLEVHLADSGIDVILTLSPADVATIVPLDTNHDGLISPEEFVAALPTLNALASQSVELRVAGQLLHPEPPEVEIDAILNLIFKLHFNPPPSPSSPLQLRASLVSRLPPGHQQFASAGDSAGHRLGESMLRADHDTMEIVPLAGTTVSASARFREFVFLGIEHIFTGYDHLLFLFGLLLVCHRFTDVIRIVTCFTAAHSITLALAALEIVNIPSKFVEPAIAASIVYVGIENIFGQHTVRSRMILTFAFGLVHGFGFASALREVGISRAAGGIAVPLVSFNLGVEIGQIAVAAIVLPILWRCHRSPKFESRWVPALSVVIALAGAYWLVTRIFMT